jgi:hypothetical protein
MLTTREHDRLIEDWPDDAANFDLEVFAAGFRSDRPELSAPALDRVHDRFCEELDRQERRSASRPSLASRLGAPITRTIRLARGADLGPRLLRAVPLAAAASMLLGAGLWLGHGYRSGGAKQTDPAAEGPRPIQPPTVVKERPTRPPPGSDPRPPLPIQ